MIIPRVLCVFHLLSLSGLACATSDTAGGEPTTGTGTSVVSTTPEVPTTGVSDDGATSSTSTTDTTSTGDQLDVSGSGTGTTGELSSCGDGVVDPTEACDDGLSGNDDSRFCKLDCTLNVCGDGELFVGWELCDQGPGNSDAYGSLCGTECEPGAYCGDHKLQGEFETCDLGRDNGGVRSDAQGILCDTNCRAQQFRGFITATAFTGDLGGLFGADLKCRDAAAAAGLAEPERFHAYLSTGDVDAKDRFDAVTTPLPYVLVTGKKFADNFPALIDEGPSGEGIAVTETGVALYTKPVATNTAPGGLHFSPEQHCQGWTSADKTFKARVGLNAVPAASPQWPDWKATQAWTGATSRQCDKKEFHLYCLEI